MSESAFFQDLAVLMTAAGVVSAVFARLGWPKVLGYILAGVVMSPHTWGGSFLLDLSSTNTIGQLGALAASCQSAEKALEALRKNREEAERQARAESERKIKAEAELKAREEAERKAEAERRAREEAERKAKAEAERRAREEAGRQAMACKACAEASKGIFSFEGMRYRQIDLLIRAKSALECEKDIESALAASCQSAEKALEALRKNRENAERQARAEAERRAREEAERREKEEAERRAREEAERRAKAEAERREKEEAERRAHEEAEFAIALHKTSPNIVKRDVGGSISAQCGSSFCAANGRVVQVVTYRKIRKAPENGVLGACDIERNCVKATSNVDEHFRVFWNKWIAIEEEDDDMDLSA